MSRSSVTACSAQAEQDGSGNDSGRNRTRGVQMSVFVSVQGGENQRGQIQGEFKVTLTGSSSKFKVMTSTEGVEIEISVFERSIANLNFIEILEIP